MVPLKWQHRRVWGVGIFWELGDGGKGRGRHTNMGLYLSIEVVHAPIILCSKVLGGLFRGMDGKAMLL